MRFASASSGLAQAILGAWLEDRARRWANPGSDQHEPSPLRLVPAAALVVGALGSSTLGKLRLGCGLPVGLRLIFETPKVIDERKVLDAFQWLKETDDATD